MYTTYCDSMGSKGFEKLWFSEPFIYISSTGAFLTRWEIVQAAEKLSDILFRPDHSQSVSGLILYEQRHHFLIALLALALNKGAAILPPDLTSNALNKLTSSNPKLVVLADNAPAELQTQSTIQSHQIDAALAHVKSNPLPFSANKLNNTLSSISDAKILLYTSGTTGEPKEIIKTWNEMTLSALVAIERFNLQEPTYIVGTVPSQHMFGLETTIFWPLFSKATLWCGRPIFPEDIIAALSVNNTQPGLLVSTPLHLDKISAFELNWPKHLSRILSATAPLLPELAEQVEQKLKVQLFEVYGSTETASIASRQTARSDLWTCYSNIEFKPLENGRYSVKTPGSECYHALNDQIELDEDNTFKLGKRDSDLIKIAGKRASLTELNYHLNAIEGVIEGTFLLPISAQRLTLFVVTSLSRETLLLELRKSVDSVFLPRPIIFLDALPRSNVGKISLTHLNALLEP